MARTPLFRLIRTVFREAGRDLSPSPTLSRRDFFCGTAAAALAATASGLPVRHALAQEKSGKGPVAAIVGSGVAGLTIAYRLAKAGHRSVIFEAGNRVGGRINTRYDFNKDGMFCELGGEFIDSNHEHIRALCKELGVELQSLTHGETGEDLYFIEGKYYSAHDLLGDKKTRGAFAELAKKIAADAEGLVSSKGWTAKARKFDAMTLQDYLLTLKPLAPTWLLVMLDVAYTIEFGLDTYEQSALNLIRTIGTDLQKGFELRAGSDEAWRIRGGSAALIKALQKATAGHTRIHQGHMLYQLEISPRNRIVLWNNTGTQLFPRPFDLVVLALPFSSLRQVQGLDTLGLSKEKLQSIMELGYGSNAKVIAGTTERVWRKDVKEFPVRSNGSFLTDLSIQCVWESSRSQLGDRGILTNYLGGRAGKKDAPEERTESLESELPRMIPGLQGKFDVEARTSMFWSKHPYYRGSYTCPMPGQVTTLLEAAATTELDGRLFFAGEHTSGDFNGYMNGAVESAERIAKELLEAVEKRKNIPAEEEDAA